MNYITKKCITQDLPMTLTNDNSSSTFGFDHCGNTSQRAADFFSLGERGFSLSPNEVEHPGTYHCRFIFFNNPRPLSQSRAAKRQCIEFCEIKDLNEAKKYYASLWAHEEKYRSNAIYMSCNQNLESIYDKHQTSHASFGIDFSHKNYDWKNDSQSWLPGWNFLTFQTNLIPGMPCTFVEFEPNKTSQPTPLSDMTHPNGAHRIMGALWAVDSLSDLNPFCKIVGKNSDDSLILDDGFRIWSGSNAELHSLGFAPKQTSFRAIVLGCKNIEEYIAIAKPDDVIDFFGTKAALIRYDENMWDIIAIEDDTPTL